MHSSELKGYLTGLILGDARIDKGVNKRALRIKNISHDFIQKIYEDISSVHTFKLGITEHPEYVSQDGTHHKKSWELVIFSHPYFAKIYHHFYTDIGSRTATKEAMSWLTPSGLANWYMSDGYVCLVGKTKGVIKCRRVDICTDRYSKPIVERMSAALLKNFNIKTSIVKRDRFYRLRIKCESYEVFFNLIRPHIVSEMFYKMYLGYEMQPVWMSDDFWHFQEELKSAVLRRNADEDIVCGMGSPWEKNPFPLEAAASSVA